MDDRHSCHEERGGHGDDTNNGAVYDGGGHDIVVAVNHGLVMVEHYTDMCRGSN